MGRTGTVLYSNLPRALAYPGALLGLWLIGGLVGLLIGFIVGEAIAIATALALLNRNTDQPPLHGFDRLLIYVLFSGVIIGWNIAIKTHAALAEGALMLASVLAALWLARREFEAIAESLALGRRSLQSLLPRAERI